ncbi:MAG: ribosome maturation factor RimP [Cellvibrionaceae bacterium]|nr:ribosome maturation factor RimP [Cellvibrionaceae bacterium]
MNDQRATGAHFLFVAGGFCEAQVSREQQLIDVIAPVVASLACEFWGLEFFPQGQHALLRVYIDKAAGVTLDDCEKVSRQVSSVLDVEDPIAGRYTLEVSSPGADRPLFTLQQFEAAVGEQAKVKLARSIEGRKHFCGMVAAVEEGDVVLRIEDEEFLLPFEWVDKANIVPQF